jgi:hypothetical protein
MDRNGVEADLRPLVFRIELGQGAEGGDARVVAQDGDLPITQHGAQGGRCARVRQVGRHHLDLDTEPGSEIRGGRVQDLCSTRDEDQ